MAAALLVVAATPLHAATFRIEIDYMENADHSHMPTQEEIDAVVQMFACQGHTLIIDVDEAIPHTAVMARDPSDSTFFGYTGTDGYGAIRDTYFDHIDDEDWYYCVFGHRYQNNQLMPSGSSGIAQLNGRYSTVTMGTFTDSIGTPFDKASTLAHEFGHNLGLTHCGSMNCNDDTQTDYVGAGAPVLASVMSYQYQLAGVREQMIDLGIARADAELIKELDYSHGRMCSLDESSLDESFGSGMNPVDWNCDMNIGGVISWDLLSEGGDWCANQVDATTVISDFDEWDVVANATAQRLLAVSAGYEPEEIECVTSSEWSQLLTTSAVLQPSLIVEPCVTGDIIFVDPAASAGAGETGHCDAAAITLDRAANILATPGSELYLRQATYNIGSGILITTPMKMFSVGSAVIK